MLDLNRTGALVKGAVFDPEPTWEGYLPEADDWKKTAVLLTGPLIVGSVLVGHVLAWIFPNFLTGRPGLGLLLVQLVSMSLAAVAVAFVVAILAGLFKGKQSFPHALAATSLAFVPGYLGNMFASLPLVGWLLQLGLGIYGLVLLWRILPSYMKIADSKRAGHYILTLVVSLIAGVVLSAVIGISAVTPDIRAGSDSYSASESGASSAPGVLGDLQRRGDLMAEAEADEYEPPDNGKLSKRQMERFVQVMEKTQAYRDEQAADLKALGERAEADKLDSIGDLMSGVKGVMNLTTAEMEVVKTGGDNWAEHQWIKEQLRIAAIQKDTNKTFAHNYRLYQEYEARLDALDIF